MLDLDLNGKRRNTGERDGNLVFLLLLLHAVFEGLAGFGEGCGRLSIDPLLDNELVEALIVVVEVVRQAEESVLVLARLARVHGDGRLGKRGVKPFLEGCAGSRNRLVDNLILDMVRGRACRLISFLCFTVDLRCLP